MQAQACAKHKGVLDATGCPVPTPHDYFVDDGLFAEVFDRSCIKRAIAASTKAIFLLLGESAIELRQDPISWDKLLEMLINYTNIALGQHINTRKMIISPSFDYMQQTNKLLSHWHSGRQPFTIPEIEPLIGKLVHLSQTSLWLKHLLGHLFVSLSAALKSSRDQLVSGSKAFRALLKLIKHNPETQEEQLQSSFAQAETARKVHKSKRKYTLLPTAKEELRIIRSA